MEIEGDIYMDEGPNGGDFDALTNPGVDWERFSGVVLIDDPGKHYANNAPLYDYRCIGCGLLAESHTREAQIWHCPRCSYMVESGRDDGERLVPLRRTYATSPSIWRVWHGHHNITTGQWVSDRKQIREQLHIASEEVSERMNLEHRFIEVDANDKDHLGVTDEGLDATHDRHVELGWKESKGRFVFPMSSPPTGTS